MATTLPPSAPLSWQKKISSKLWNHRGARTGYKCVLVSLAHHQTPPPPHQRVSVSPLLQIEKMGKTWFISSFTLQSVDFFCQLTSISKSQESAFQRTFISCILYFVPTPELNLTCVQQARLPLQCAATQPPTAAARWPTMMIVIMVMVMVMRIERYHDGDGQVYDRSS